MPKQCHESPTVAEGGLRSAASVGMAAAVSIAIFLSPQYLFITTASHWYPRDTPLRAGADLSLIIPGISAAILRRAALAVLGERPTSSASSPTRCQRPRSAVMYCLDRSWSSERMSRGELVIGWNRLWRLGHDSADHRTALPTVATHTTAPILLHL